jgi:hypothetical protein
MNLYKEAKNAKETYQKYHKEYKKSLRFEYSLNKIKFDILYLSSRGSDTLIIVHPVNDEITTRIIKKLLKDGFLLEIKKDKEDEEEIRSIKIKW